jgi:hypothetical protein
MGFAWSHGAFVLPPRAQRPRGPTHLASWLAVDQADSGTSGALAKSGTAVWMLQLCLVRLPIAGSAPTGIPGCEVCRVDGRSPRFSPVGGVPVGAVRPRRRSGRRTKP